MASQPKFRDGEKVLSFYGQVIYEAICEKTRYDDQKRANYCFVKHKGMGKKWEKWVAETRVMRYNKANMQKHGCITIIKLEEPEPGDGDNVDDQKDDEEDDDDEALNSINIELPPNLLMYLKDDWRRINRDGMIVRLPPPITVTELLDEYMTLKSPHDFAYPHKGRLRRELTDAIRTYFNYMVGSKLLYEEEEIQHALIIAEHGEDYDMCDVYGAVHFLRLFVRLGWALGFTKMDERQEGALMILLHDLISYIDYKSEIFFTPDNYEPKI